MIDKLARYLKEAYKVMLVVLTLGFFWALADSIGKNHIFFTGLKKLFTDDLFKNPNLSIATLIIILAPLIYLLLFKVISLLFPTDTSWAPLKARANMIVARLTGILVSLVAILVIMQINHHKSEFNVVYYGISGIWLLITSILMFRFSGVTNASKAE